MPSNWAYGGEDRSDRSKEADCQKFPQHVTYRSRNGCLESHAPTGLRCPLLEWTCVECGVGGRTAESSIQLGVVPWLCTG